MSDRDVDKPWVRTRILRKVRNAFPGWKVEFIEGLRSGLGFRVLDARGQPKSSIVRVYVLKPDLFTDRWLRTVVTKYGREPPSSRTLTLERRPRHQRRRVARRSAT